MLAVPVAGSWALGIPEHPAPTCGELRMWALRMSKLAHDGVRPSRGRYSATLMQANDQPNSKPRECI